MMATVAMPAIIPAAIVPVSCEGPFAAALDVADAGLVVVVVDVVRVEVDLVLVVDLLDLDVPVDCEEVKAAEELEVTEVEVKAAEEIAAAEVEAGALLLAPALVALEPDRYWPMIPGSRGKNAAVRSSGSHPSLVPQALLLQHPRNGGSVPVHV